MAELMLTDEFSYLICVMLGLTAGGLLSTCPALWACGDYLDMLAGALATLVGVAAVVLAAIMAPQPLAGAIASGILALAVPVVYYWFFWLPAQKRA